ncbi:MAG: hypothetical protein HY305_03600 [Sphingobacteriales bacterium]|nr:hypothetical protein [Sphingobacteriales bacterium]
MLQQQYITSSCVISQQVVYKNGLPVFSKTDTDLAGLLLATYQHFDISYPKFYKMDKLSKSGWLATEILLQGTT